MSQSEIKGFKSVGVIGAGAWGTALAIQSSFNADSVLIYSRDAELSETINKNSENSVYLPGIKLSSNIKAISNLDRLMDCDLLLLSIPSQSIRDFILKNRNVMPSQPVLLCSKGIENATLKLLSDVVLEFWNVPIMVIAGPNFAKEVAMNKISATTIASSDLELSMRVAKTISSENFRVYHTDDIVGVQVLGAIKNVIAIAAGITIGLDLGENCKAALITRGLNEACKLITHMGGKLETALGLAGIGDIILTATSITSRNTELGCNLARGMNINALNNKTVEGYYSCKSLHDLGVGFNIDMPIINGLYSILYEDVDINSVIKGLLERP